MTTWSETWLNPERGTEPATVGDSSFVARILYEPEEFSTTALKRWVAGGAAECGATVVFEGIVRGTEAGAALAGLRYETHETMAPRELAAVCADARSRFRVNRIAVEHRAGFVATGDVSVVVIVGASHRAEAFEACRFVMDEIKLRVPIWKHTVEAVPAAGEPTDTRDAAHV